MINVFVPKKYVYCKCTFFYLCVTAPPYLIKNTNFVTELKNWVRYSFVICRKLKHDNIVKLIGYALQEQRLYIVMELIAQSMLTCITEKQVMSKISRSESIPHAGSYGLLLHNYGFLMSFQTSNNMLSLIQG